MEGCMQKQAEFVKLSWDDTRSLCYKTEDSHIGVTTVQQAVSRLQFADFVLDSISYLEDVKESLRTWVFAHKDKIETAFLTLQDQHFLFLVITKATNFDDNFEDELSDLDIDIAKKKGESLLHLSVQALPNCGEEQYGSFLNPQMIFECRM